jgi:transposase
VAASFAHGVTVSEIARRNDISPQHLHQWRRAARSGRLVLPLEDDLAFAPVVLNERRSEQAPLELEIAGAVIRVRPDTDLRLMTVVIQALKGSA